MNIYAKIRPEEYVEELECNCTAVLNEGAAYLFAIQRLGPVFVRKALSVFDTDNVYKYDERVEVPARFVTLELLYLPLPGIRRFQPRIDAIRPDDGTRWESEIDRLMEMMRVYNEGETGTVHTTNPLMRGVVAVVDAVVDNVLYAAPDAKPAEPSLMSLDERAWIDRVAPMLARGFPKGQRIFHVEDGSAFLPLRDGEMVLPAELREIARNLYTVKETAQQSANKQASVWMDAFRYVQATGARSRSQSRGLSRSRSPSRQGSPGRQTGIEPADAENKRQNKKSEDNDNDDGSVADLTERKRKRGGRKKTEKAKTDGKSTDGHRKGNEETPRKRQRG